MKTTNITYQFQHIHIADSSDETTGTIPFNTRYRLGRFDVATICANDQTNQIAVHSKRHFKQFLPFSLLILKLFRHQIFPLKHMLVINHMMQMVFHCTTHTCMYWHTWQKTQSLRSNHGGSTQTQAVEPLSVAPKSNAHNTHLTLIHA